MANIPKFTPEKREIILDALHNHPALGRAARKARISRRTLWLWRRDNPEFANECEEARTQGFEALEDALITRGEKNDTTAAIFMLKGWNPDRYKERTQHDHKHNHEHRHYDLSMFSPEEKEQIAELAAKYATARESV